MKTKTNEMKTKTIGQVIYFVLISFIALMGCKPGSIAIKGDDCKMNGNFEIIKKGLPVNWNYYAPETVTRDGDFSIISDSTLFREGGRSLKFLVNQCDSTGGVCSPGFFKEFKVLPGETYNVSFWVINKGCKFKVDLGTGMEGNPGLSKTIVKTKDSNTDWKFFEYSLKIPPTNDNIRFEANILSPGTIWFDDIKIVREIDSSEVTVYPYKGDEECK